MVERLTVTETPLDPPSDSRWMRLDDFHQITFVSRGRLGCGALGMLLFINAFWNGIVSVFLMQLFGGEDGLRGAEWWAAIIDQTEYNTLRATLNAAAQQQTDQGGTLLADMVAMLRLPGDADGHGGGLDLGSAAVVAMLQQFAAAVPGLENVPAKVAAYVASQQPLALRRWADPVCPGHVQSARKMIEEAR